MHDNERAKLLSQIPGVVFQFLKKSDGTYCIPFASPSIQEFFGVSPEDVREDASPAFKSILPEDASKVIDSIEQSAKKLTLWKCEYRVQLPGKPVRWVWGQAMPEKLKDGSILWHGFNADISDRKKAEENLRDFAVYLDNIMNRVADPIFVKDDRYRFVSVNDALCAFLGIPRKELIGKTDGDFFSEDQRDVFFEKDRKVLETGEDNVNEEYLTDGHGAVRTIVTKKTRYVDRDNNRFIVGTIRDITERITAEREKGELQKSLLQAEKMSAVGQLASGIAHEINNPLAVILGFSQGALRDIDPGSPLAFRLSSIEREAQRCKRIVQNLLVFARQGKMEKMECDMGKIVESVLSLIETQAKLRSIEVKRTILDGLPKVSINENEIQQVIVNLCNNALDAMDNNGALSVRVETIESDSKLSVQISVADTGCGIPAEHLEKIYHPFFTTKEVGKGTGLGLYLVYEIVREHGGKIEVESKLKKGTTFKIQIPAVQK